MRGFFVLFCFVFETLAFLVQTYFQKIELVVLACLACQCSKVSGRGSLRQGSDGVALPRGPGLGLRGMEFTSKVQLQKAEVPVQAQSQCPGCLCQLELW